MTIQQIAVVVVQVHPAAEAIAEHFAVGAFAALRPVAFAERLEAVLPHVPEFVAVNIALVEVGPDGGAARNRPVDPDGGHRNPGGTLVEVVADLGFVAAQKSLAGIADLDAALFPRLTDEFQHPAELGVGQPQRRVVLGAPHRENREQPPRPHALGNQHVAESLQLRNHGSRHAGHHVERQARFADQKPHRIERFGVAQRIAADIVVFALEAVQTDRNAPQSRVDQPAQAPFGQRHAVGDHPPRIAPACDFAAREFQVVAHQHLAPGKDNQHRRGVGMRRHLFVEHPQEIGHGHVFHPGVHPAVAAAMTARQIAPQRAFPKERIEPMLGDRRAVKVGKYVEGQPLAEPQPSSGHDYSACFSSCGACGAGIPVGAVTESGSVSITVPRGGRTPYITTIR